MEIEIITFISSSESAENLSCKYCFSHLPFAKHELYDEMSNTEFDEQMLNELESRMNLLNNLKRKYGKDINELITYKDKASK